MLLTVLEFLELSYVMLAFLGTSPGKECVFIYWCRTLSAEISVCGLYEVSKMFSIKSACSVNQMVKCALSYGTSEEQNVWKCHISSKCNLGRSISTNLNFRKKLYTCANMHSW